MKKANVSAVDNLVKLADSHMLWENLCSYYPAGTLLKSTTRCQLYSDEGLTLEFLALNTIVLTVSIQQHVLDREFVFLKVLTSSSQVGWVNRFNMLDLITGEETKDKT